MKLKTPKGREVIVACGDHVVLRNGWKGVAYNWTELGVMVRLNDDCEVRTANGFRVLAVDAGDWDIRAVLTKGT